MDKEDKILITAYLDGEASETESHHVEHLLTKDQDALEYANSLKKANFEINDFFESNEKDELERQIDLFFDSRKLKSISMFSFQNLFKFSKDQSASILIKSFNPFAITGYALSAFLTFSFFIYEPSNKLLNNPLDSLVNKNTIIVFDKYRNDDLLGQFYIETLKTMIQRKSISANVSFGDESFYIKITNYEKLFDSVDCYSLSSRSSVEVNNYLVCLGENPTFIRNLSHE